MRHQHSLTRPCDGILQTALRPQLRVTSNDSSSVWECMSWGYQGNPRNVECAHNQGVRHHLSQSAQLGSNIVQVGKCDCCEDGEYFETSTGQYIGGGDGYTQSGSKAQPNKVNLKSYVQKQKQSRGNNSNVQGNRAPQSQKTGQKSQKKGKVAGESRNAQPVYDRMAVEETRKRRLDQLMRSRQRSVDRLKVEEFVESQRPFTRAMSNTRFRTMFGKECMEAYGRNNTNQPIGGIMYGNNLKTFNINPHASSNDPRYYQTHTTALNFAKRSKLDQEKNWKLLQKQLGKQLQLDCVNETLIPGKETTIQEVTADNMYMAMKVNQEFKRENRGQIRQMENDYKRSEVQKQWDRQDQYKAQRNADRELLKNAPLASTMAGSEAEDEFRKASGTPEERLGRQVIYKLVDEQGNVRYGADRHSLTCYVDMNFPENQAAYTVELNNRNPILCKKVKQEDRHLDQIRKENYVQSVVNNYPAHYLIPNVDYSKVVLKPRPERSRSPTRQKRPHSSGINLAKQPRTTQTGSPVFTNTKLDAQVNNIQRQQAGSPKGQLKGRVQFEAPDHNPKSDYNAQSTGNSLGQMQRTHNHQTNTKSNGGQHQASQQQMSSHYAASLRSALVDESTRNPHFATQLLVKACDNSHTLPGTNQRIVNQEYDSRNYYPHANHEMKPKLYQSIKATKIPYAGVQSKILDAI